MVDNGQQFLQWSTMVNHGQDNDFIMVFDGWPWTNMVDHQKTSKTVVTMVIISPRHENKLLTERAAISQKVATQQPKLN